ncbi:hypothetical protein [Paenibacillus chitinolyticus]|uniref:hypothetical protein n=1 Tax=Paenibacillus chitinolyticus TaxID=79263 RepID=UPI00366F57ED
MQKSLSDRTHKRVPVQEAFFAGHATMVKGEVYLQTHRCIRENHDENQVGYADVFHVRVKAFVSFVIQVRTYEGGSDKQARRSKCNRGTEVHEFYGEQCGNAYE